MANLPGVYTNYKERKPVVVAAEPATDEILFLGTATDGPTFTPVTITRPTEAINVFGTYTVPAIGSPMLVPAASEAYYAGARNITLVRITGVDATAELESGVGVLEATLFGKYPGAKYNNVAYEVTDSQFKVWSVADSLANATNPTKTYSIADGQLDTLDKLALAINKDTTTTDLRMVVAKDRGTQDPKDAFGVIAKTNLTGGDDELNPSLGTYSPQTGLRGALAKAYDLFYEYDADMIVPLGVSVGMTEDATPTFDKEDAMKLAEFCFEAALRNNDIIGAIGVKPLADTSLAGMSAFVSQLASVDNTYVNNAGVDIGRYINIVVGEPIFEDNLVGSYANLGTAAYFGLASSLAVQSGTTNKVMKNAVNLRYNLSPSQIETLKNNRFTVLRYRIDRGVIVTEGLIASLPGSDFNALSTVRIIHGITDAIRLATEPFIGEPLDLPHTQGIDTAIRDVLATFAKNGAITTGNFQMFFAGNNAIVGDIDIELELEIPAELRRIIVTVSRRLPTLSQSQA
jgi:hypothetical protein